MKHPLNLPYRAPAPTDRNGHLEDYRERQHFTSDSKQRRDERQAQKHRAEKGKRRGS